MEKTSFAAVFWPLFAAVLAPSNSDSSKCPNLNAAVKNRSNKWCYLLRLWAKTAAKSEALFAAVSG